MPEQIVPVADHVARILDAVTPLAVFDQALMDALGLPVAEDVTAPMPLPSFDNSAMDGYAVVFKDVADAREDRPVHLPVVGEIGAGQAGMLAMSPGTAVKIMTGAPVPQGCTAVVPYEWTDRGVAQVRISKAPTEGQHIRHAGEDVAGGRRTHLRGHRPRPPPARAAGRRGPGLGEVAPASAGGGDVDRHRAARARDGARPRLDLRRQLLHARRRGHRRRRHRLPRRRRRGRRPRVHRGAHRPAGARRHRGDQRRCQPG